jgi:hypothetical protein
MIAHYDTLTSLWHKTAQSMLFAKREELDFVASIDTMIYDNVLSCDSMRFDFDLGRDLWLTKSRFTILQRDYLDLRELESFLDRCKSIGLGEAKRGVVTQMFAKQHLRRDKKYRWGNCMLGWSFKSIPYLFRFGLEDVLSADSREYPSANHPTLKLVRKWYGGVLQAIEDGKPLEAEKYGPLKRIRRRHGEYLVDPDHSLGVSPPRIPLKQLNFDPLRARG